MKLFSLYILVWAQVFCGISEFVFYVQLYLPTCYTGRLLQST